jgi:hypothetical protein
MSMRSVIAAVALAGLGGLWEARERALDAATPRRFDGERPSPGAGTLEAELSVPGERLRHAVIAGPGRPASSSATRSWPGEAFVIAAEFGGHTEEGDGGVAAWVIGDPYGDLDAYKAIAADATRTCTRRSAGDVRRHRIRMPRPGGAGAACSRSSAPVAEGQ